MSDLAQVEVGLADPDHQRQREAQIETLISANDQQATRRTNLRTSIAPAAGGGMSDRLESPGAAGWPSPTGLSPTEPSRLAHRALTR